MFASIARFRSQIVFAGLALTLLVSAGTPALGGQDAAAKRGKDRPHHSRQVKQSVSAQAHPKLLDIAVTDIVIAPHADPGHRTVVVEVTNLSPLRNSGQFTVGMQAERADGTLRNEVFSASLSLARGESTEVEFRLGCNWINNGTIHTRTNPSPVPGEPASLTANNTREESFGGGCV